MTTLDDRYPDLLGASADATTIRVVGTLDALRVETTPPRRLATDMDRALAARMNELERRRPQAHRARRPTWISRPAIILAALLATVVVGGTVYAAVAALGDRALSGFPGTAPIERQHLGRAISVTREACGYGLTINRIYADPQQVVIGYTLTAPRGQNASPYPPFYDERQAPILTDEATGRRFPQWGNGSGPLVDNAAGHFLSFDTSGMTHLPRVLRLRLTLPTLAMATVNSSAPSLPPSCSGAVHVEGRTQTVTVNGPFTYALSVPVDPAQTVALHAMGHARGITVAVTRMTITHITARLVLRVQGPAPRTWQEANLNDARRVTLALSGKGQPASYDGWVIRRVGPLHTLPTGDATYAGTLPAPLLGYRGRVLLTVYTNSRGKPLANGGFRVTGTDPVTLSVTLGAG